MLVYKATNIINEVVYIGKTTKRFSHRKADHIFKSKRKPTSYFHRALNKYGKDNFKWKILAETDSKTKLDVLEKFYIMLYKKMGKIYNLTEGGDGKSGYKASPETVEKIRKANTGYIHTEEAKERSIQR